MSPRPVRTIRPSSKLGAGNAAHLELSYQRSAIKLARATTTNDLSPPSQITTKWPRPQPNTGYSESSSTNDADTTDVPLQTPSVPALKKAKTTIDANPAETNVSITEISDESDDDRSEIEHLNKTDPTADIKTFFTAVPSVPGQNKQRM